MSQKRRPIYTAPKGKAVIVFAGSNAGEVAAWDSDRGWVRASGGPIRYSNDALTHWCDIPEIEDPTAVAERYRKALLTLRAKMASSSTKFSELEDIVEAALEEENDG